MDILDRENWMSHLDKNARIVDSYIPASHDSSCYPTTDVLQTFSNEWVGAVTQLFGYTAQLNTGVRYFDMRVARHNGDLYMHHNTDWFFEKFDDVLRQIRTFSDDHPGEYIFMDVDFDASDRSLATDILTKIEQHIDTSKIATAHLNGGVFNPNVTWNDLGDTRFLITWALNDWMNRTWLGFCDYFRYSPFDNFGSKTVQEITNFIDHGEIDPQTNQLTPCLDNWQKDRLFIAQAINTPLLSFITHPGQMDANAQEALNSWIINKRFDVSSGSLKLIKPKLNIVMRDFVNAGYNRLVIDQIIQWNTFSEANTMSLGAGIEHLDTLRFRTEHGHYLSLGPGNKITLVDAPDASCNFMIRDYDFDPRKPFLYSNNMDGDDIRDQGNFRLIPNGDNQAGNLTKDNTNVLSINSPDGKHCLYFPMSWHDAADQESFTCFDPDNSADSDEGQICEGSRVVIRSMIGAANNWFQKIFNTMEETVIENIPFVGDAFNAAMQGNPGTHVFLMVTYDQQGNPGVYAASPGLDYATTFIIEKVG